MFTSGLELRANRHKLSIYLQSVEFGLDIFLTIRTFPKVVHAVTFTLSGISEVRRFRHNPL